MPNSEISRIFDLANRNIVLTGSAGLLGYQYAHILSQAGANVILVDINRTKNKQLEKELIQKYNTQPRAYYADISKKIQVQNLRKAIVSRYKKIDVLVNNAAFTTKGSQTTSSKTYLPFEKFPSEIWDQSLAINLTGIFYCCQEFGNVMLQEKKGVIVNISSTYGLVGADQRIYGKSKLNLPVSYAATKGAIVNLTRYLAAYWQGKNIRVNTLSPGGVLDTTYQTKEFVKQYSKRTMLGRMARKNEYNGALLFLVSDASSYMTGSNLVIDGGWTAW